jgi:hypothetical protein
MPGWGWLLLAIFVGVPLVLGAMEILAFSLMGRQLPDRFPR